MPDINIVTFNARGLRLMSKRRALFRYFHQYFPTHLIVLQETHAALRDSTYWEAEWGAPIKCAYGRSTNECGVAVLFPRCLLGLCNVTVIHADEDGRLLILCLEFKQFKLLLCAVYAPT